MNIVVCIYIYIYIYMIYDIFCICNILYTMCVPYWWNKDPFTAARTILALKQTISSSVPSLRDFHRVG